MPTAWEVETAVYANKFKYVGGEEGLTLGMTFKPDGLKMYIVGVFSKKVFQYSLSVAWDVDTAVYENKFKLVSGEASTPFGLFFKSDGLKMYVVGNGSKKVFQYSLSVAWDVDTAVYEIKFKYVGDEDTGPRGLAFRPDGLKMYIMGGTNLKVFQYLLSTAWEVETASYENKFKLVGGQDTIPANMRFKPDGIKMYVTGYANKKIFQYLLSTPWDVDTAVYEIKFKYVGDEDTGPRGMIYGPDGLKMYMVGTTNDKVYQYSLPPAPAGQPFALRRRDRYIGGVVR